MGTDRPAMGCTGPSDGGWHETSGGPSIFGELLRKYRMRAELTQLQLNLRLRERGFVVGEKVISMWETGQRLPSDSAVFHYLGVCLSLTAEEEAALIDAYGVAHEIRFMVNYWRTKSEES